ncbi:MAG: DUF4402 domain-containing protein [Pseudomonadota bacterium]
MKKKEEKKEKQEGGTMKKLLSVVAVTMFISGAAYATDQSFSVSMKLLKAITISKIQDLSFPDTTLTGSAFTVAVAPADSTAAVFNAQGGKNRNITRSVVEVGGINMSAPGVATTILIDSFLLSGPTAFDGSGNANNIRVGATANILATSEDGDYSGTATMRVVYQ